MTISSEMSLEEFRSSVRVLAATEAAAVRRRFVVAFLDSPTNGRPMWGGLRDRQRVSLARLWATVAATDVVTVMWDPPASDGGDVPHQRGGFGPLDVLECRVVDLERGVDWLPDDLYVFDGTYTWSAIFTHETDVDGGVQLLARAGSVVV